MKFLASSKKALGGAVSAAVAMLVVVAQDGVTGTEWGQVAGAAVVGFLGVYFAPKNKDAEAE